MDDTQIQETHVPQILSSQSSLESDDSEEDYPESSQSEHGDQVLRCVRRKCSTIPYDSTYAQVYWFHCHIVQQIIR